MTNEPRATGLTTILFTDLVNSTELMQRAGDEDAQRIFKAHYQLLRDAVSANGGSEVKSLGDGLMVAFTSAADAVRCAVMMQQSSRRSVAGQQLAVKVGINAGEAALEDGDFFGTPVVVARRLCDRAEPGQVICSAVVESLLAGRQAFSFRDIGQLELKGIAAPVDAREVLFESEQPGAFLTRTPFVGRSFEMARLLARLDEARAGRGGLVMVVGEPGIGKSRTIEEFCEFARSSGATVLWGRCFEGEWAPPYGPFAEAIAGFAKDADPETLRADLGYGAPPIARLAPAIRERLPDVEEPAPLQPDEERFRLLDAVSQFVIALSARAPVVLVLDDLHWADRGTIAMMRHVARFAPKHRTLIVGAYRDVELDRQHPLADALSAMRREVEYERISLKGLGRDDVGALLQTIAEQEVNQALAQAISDETDGNPFFIREVLIHLVEEGKLYREDGQWRSKAQSIADLGIPEGVRQVITRRLSRLGENANRVLSAASGFNGEFRIQTIGMVAGFGEAATLDAIDEALDAQILRPAERADHYDFTHALIRHTLYGELNPSRQVRLHRQIAEALETRVAAYTPERQAAHAGELAYQFHRSAAIPGAERGVEFAMQAADVAESTGAWDEVVGYLTIALELLPAGDARRGAIMGRLAIAQAWALMPEEAERNATEAARMIAEFEDHDAAADYLASASLALAASGYRQDVGWRLAGLGLKYTHPDRRDATWARLALRDLMRIEAEDPDNPGIPLPSGLRDEIWQVMLASDDPEAHNVLQTQTMMPIYTSRSEGVAFLAAEMQWLHAHPNAVLEAALRAWTSGLMLGRLRDGLAGWQELTAHDERIGAVVRGVADRAFMARFHYALGEIAAGDAALERAREVLGRIGSPGTSGLQLIAAEDDRRSVSGDWSGAQEIIQGIGAQQVLATRWASAAIFAGLSRAQAVLGRDELALTLIAQVVEPLDRAPGQAANYPRIACNVAEALWIMQRTDHVEAIERALREKVVGPDFRYFNVDGRLALARVYALKGQYDEASEWFVKARSVLEEQGARPLRAICDHDEALMYVRRGADGDREGALPLLDAALAQFREIGMTGWVKRGEELRVQLGV